ncbi:MAG: hypothetical protein M1813_001602 [Trichoglossum hirsutum]|nr:MAG: hypothetical protein M1813_001602 [Trichoglossum hirsutum]
MRSESEIEERLAAMDGASEQLLPLSPRPPRVTPYVTVIEANNTTTRGSGSKRRFSIRDSVFRLLGFLWCVPALWVLVVNFQQHIVGPSLWCAGCYPSTASTGYFSRIAYLLAKDHDVIGVLQLVAKALELWFLAVAASLLHDLISLKAEEGGGVAFGLLTAYLEFKEMRYLVSPSLWRSLPVNAQKRAKATVGYLLVFFVVALALESAVIGPAMAVLLIPTLQLREVQRVKGPTAQVAAAGPPSNPLLVNCSSQLLSIGNYSCIGPLYSSSLDAMLTGAAFSNVTQPNTYLAPGVSQENHVFFQLNATRKGRDIFVWSPNRSVLREVSAESYEQYLEAINQAVGKPAPGLDGSQQTLYHRVGPVISAVGNCVQANVSISVVGPSKEIRCYGVGSVLGKDVFENTCVKYGPGWDLGIDRSQFFLGWEDKWDKTWVASVNVTVFQTDQVFAFRWGNGTCPLKQAYDGQWLLDGPCPWNDLFERSAPSLATFVEYRVPGVTYPNQTVLCVSKAYLGYRDYVIDDLGPQQNGFPLITLQDLPQNITEKLIRMHPDWLLAGWSVDRNGMVPSRRASAQIVVDAIRLILDDPSEGNVLYMSLVQQLVLSQAASLIDYRITPFNGTIDEANPRLDTWRIIKVYSYGFFSVTTRLSAATVVAGILFCFGYAILFVVKGSQGFRTFQDLLVMAFKYRPGPEVGAGGGGGGIRTAGIRVTTNMLGDSDFVVDPRGKDNDNDISGDREGGTAHSGLLHGGEGGGGDIELQGSSGPSGSTLT